MKFSQKKKDKMRKIRQKRIQKTYGSMVAMEVYGNYRVIDHAKIFDNFYLLGNNGEECAVFKIADVGNIVKLSLKSVRKLSKYLSNKDRWCYQSYVPIDSDGKLIQSEIKSKFLRKQHFINQP